MTPSDPEVEESADMEWRKSGPFELLNAVGSACCGRALTMSEIEITFAVAIADKLEAFSPPHV